MSGARFNVISSRRSPLHQFVIQEIKKPGAAAGRSSGRAESPSFLLRQLLNAAAAPSLPLPASGRRGWLARILGRKSDVIPAFGMIDSRVLARGVIHFHLHDLIREGGNERSDWSSG
jgi:hypothetical protein